MDVSPALAPVLRLLPSGGDEGGEDLRSRARRAAVVPNGNEPLAELWEELVTGREHAVDAFIDDERCFLVTRPARPDERLPALVNPRNRAILTRVLLGEPQKHVAYEFGVSASSITSIAKQYAQAMGFESSVSRLPIFLVVAAHAAARGLTEAMAASATFEHDGVRHRVLCAARPDPARWANLSEKECEVVTLLVERYPNADIARLRQRSPRTVANQLSSVMHKTGARGRCEIIYRMLEGRAS
ncbi:MAG TPA: LuxR C-terminal-related transcriptional regulator [Polyangiaceae bacterium]|nr:LuxR C-terminal-related transcriptional regulator [Polyangiaceae bacterium]